MRAIQRMNLSFLVHLSGKPMRSFCVGPCTACEHAPKSPEVLRSCIRTTRGPRRPPNARFLQQFEKVGFEPESACGAWRSYSLRDVGRECANVAMIAMANGRQTRAADARWMSSRGALDVTSTSEPQVLGLIRSLQAETGNRGRDPCDPRSGRRANMRKSRR